MKDLVDDLLAEWDLEQPERDFSALGIVVRIQLLSKLLADGTEKALDELGLKHWEYDVLSALRRQGRPYQMSATELAEASMLTSGTVTTRVDRLQDRGLVRRKPNPGDRRAVFVELTPEGSALIERAINARLARANAQLECLTRKQRPQLSAGLRTILTHLAA